MANNGKDEKPNPEVKDNGDGTKTLTYRQTEEQKKQDALREELTKPKK